MEKIKVMIAEDHKLLREAIVRQLSDVSSNIELIGASEDGIALMKALESKVPDIILLDISMPQMNGWQVLEELKQTYPSVRTIIYSGDFNVSHVWLAILGGARAFIDKWQGDEQDLVAAIESVYENGFYFNQLVSRDIIRELNRRKELPILIENSSFSDREMEVIEQICDGKQIKEIAASLNISDGTVKYHKGNLFKKTETNTNMDLLKYAICHGIYNVFDLPKKTKA